MAHSLFLGMTEMGKTTLARGMCSVYRARGFETIVLDPMRDPRWKASFLTADGDEFLDIAKRSRKCMLFADEGSQSVGRYNLEMEWIVTQSRHWGHSANIICQGGTQLAVIIRDQCSHVFLFACGARTAKMLSEEFNAPDLELCVALKPREYFHAVKGGACTFHSSQRSFEDAYIAYNSRGRTVRNRRDAGAAKEAVEVGDSDSDSSGGSAGGAGGGPD